MTEFAQSDVIKFIDPVYRFCVHRLNSPHDAEDLASEIMLHVIDGFGKYEIQSLESWVWRIARNRYARFIDKRKHSPSLMSDEVLMTFGEYDDSLDNAELNEEYLSVYKALHSLSADYRNIAVDYYIGEMTVREIAQRYAINETTVKWRLNVSREKMTNRIGEYEMEKIYKRLNWNTNACNGYMDSDKYLNSQISRAICEAAYEKPLTIEEISMRTGIPALYIEDEMSSLLYGDAIVKEGNKYLTNFIVLRLKDREKLKEYIKPLVNDCADYYEKIFDGKENIDKLGYIVIPETIRSFIWDIKNNELNLANGAYPKRQDGGYGWFIISETVDEENICDPYDAGCNQYSKDNESLVYYTICDSPYNDALNSIRNNGFKIDGLNETQLVELIKSKLVVKCGDEYKFNFPCFTTETYKEFIDQFKLDSDNIHDLIKQLILKVREAFVMFTPKHLESQINQWVSCFLSSITSYIVEELTNRDVLAQVDDGLLMYNIYYIDKR